MNIPCVIRRSFTTSFSRNIKLYACLSLYFHKVYFTTKSTIKLFSFLFLFLFLSLFLFFKDLRVKRMPPRVNKYLLTYIYFTSVYIYIISNIFLILLLLFFIRYNDVQSAINGIYKEAKYQGMFKLFNFPCLRSYTHYY